MVRLFSAFIIVIVSQTLLPAQVKFMLDYSALTGEYTVSMLPEKTWRPPYNKTATGQVTLKATTGQFVVKDIVSHVQDTRWTPSGRINSPAESPKYDYIFFRLKTPGLTEVPYQAFRPTKLFTFTLESRCAREVMLVSNTEDAFLPPNSRNINIGNSIGVLGADGEAYIGNVSDLPIFCPYAVAPPKANAVQEEDSDEDNKITVKPTTATAIITKPKLYPNPTVDEVNVEFTWNGKANKKDVLVYNEAGELVRFFPQEVQNGKNTFQLNIGDLENGIYNFLIISNKETLTIGKTIKVE